MKTPAFVIYGWNPVLPYKALERVESYNFPVYSEIEDYHEEIMKWLEFFMN